MVQALVNLGEREDRVLNMVKAKYGLPNKSEAVNLVLREYGEAMLEPELRPELEKELEEIEKEKRHPFSTIAELRKMIEND